MTSTAPIRVVVADDESLVRQGIARHVDEQSDMTVVAESENADHAVQCCVELKPNVIVMDIDMPGRSPFDAVREISRHHPGVQVLFLTGYASDSMLEQALGLVNASVATKSDDPVHLVTAIRSTISGGRYFSPDILRRIEVTADRVRVRAEVSETLATLTQREHEVLGYVAAGMSKKDMGETMHLSVKTIENHTQSLMAKLGIHNRVELTLFAIRHGISRP